MATARRVETTPIPPPPPVYELTLTSMEAEILRNLLGAVVSPTADIGRYVHAIHAALSDAGVERNQTLLRAFTPSARFGC